MAMKIRLMFLCLLLFASAPATARAGDLTGRWTVTISTGGHTISGVAFLKQTGDKLEGSIGADERNQHPVDGTVKGNVVTLVTHPRPGRTVAFDKCTLKVNGEKLTGTTEGGDLRDKAAIELVRVSEK